MSEDARHWVRCPGCAPPPQWQPCTHFPIHVKSDVADGKGDLDLVGWALIGCDFFPFPPLISAPALCNCEFWFPAGRILLGIRVPAVAIHLCGYEFWSFVRIPVPPPLHLWIERLGCGGVGGLWRDGERTGGWVPNTIWCEHPELVVAIPYIFSVYQCSHGFWFPRCSGDNPSRHTQSLW